MSLQPVFRVIEFALTAWLVLGLPALAWWQHVRKGTRPERTRRAGLQFNVAMIATMLGVMALLAWGLGWSPADLGFDLPLSRAGEIGLVIALALIAATRMIDAVWKRRHPEAAHRARAQFDVMLPRTAADLHWLAAFTLVAGTGWEILYRGFLLWVLSPLIGVVGAVCVAATAYGLAHAFKSRKQVLGTLVLSFAFTLAFVFTHSLWWLMLVHVYMGVPIVLIGRRMLRERLRSQPGVADEPVVQ